MSDVTYQERYNAANAEYIRLVAELRDTRAAVRALAREVTEEFRTLRAWADASVVGGWSTHQVDPMRRRAEHLAGVLASHASAIEAAKET